MLVLLYRLRESFGFFPREYRGFFHFFSHRLSPSCFSLVLFLFIVGAIRPQKSLSSEGISVDRVSKCPPYLSSIDAIHASPSSESAASPRASTAQGRDGGFGAHRGRKLSKDRVSNATLPVAGFIPGQTEIRKSGCRSRIMRFRTFVSDYRHVSPVPPALSEQFATAPFGANLDLGRPFHHCRVLSLAGIGAQGLPSPRQRGFEPSNQRVPAAKTRLTRRPCSASRHSNVCQCMPLGLGPLP